MIARPSILHKLYDILFNLVKSKLGMTEWNSTYSDCNFCNFDMASLLSMLNGTVPLCRYRFPL